MLFLNYLHENFRQWNEQQYRLSRFFFSTNQPMR